MTKTSPAALAKTQTAAPPPTPAIIVLGKDDSGKPHASWFDQSERPMAAKAAAIMGMRILSVDGAALAALAAKLPHGRIFASGRAFVPFVKAALFNELAAHLPKRDGDAPLRVVTGHNREVNGNEYGAEDDATGESGPETPAPSLPEDWSKIAAGSLVLASEGPQQGWFEAVVTEVRGGDLFALRWRDWPEEAVLVRHREHLGLLHPHHSAA